jgi:hypothetical protein
MRQLLSLSNSELFQLFVAEIWSPERHDYFHGVQLSYPEWIPNIFDVKKYENILSWFEERANLVGQPSAVNRTWFSRLTDGFFEKSRIRRQRYQYMNLPFESVAEYGGPGLKTPPKGKPIIIFLTHSPATALYLSATLAREWNGHLVFYQYRPECIATAQDNIGGSCVGPVKNRWGEPLGWPKNRSWPDSSRYRGTVGGSVLVHGQRYFVTCGHVFPDIEQGSVSIKPPSKFRRLADLCGIRLLPRQLPCMALGVRYPKAFIRHLRNVSDPTVDVAFLRVERGEPSIRAPDGYIEPEHLAFKEAISFCGKSSGRVTGQVGGIMSSHIVRINGQPTTCRNSLVIDPAYVGQRIAARGGDSGAWAVVTRGGSNFWAGMVFSTDGQKTYCTLATDVVDEMYKVLKCDPPPEAEIADEDHDLQNLTEGTHELVWVDLHAYRSEPIPAGSISLP